MTMSTVRQMQFFLFVLILGFLLGPRVIEALQHLQPDVTEPVATNEMRDSTSSGETPEPALTVIEDPYGELMLRGKSAYVWDISARQKLYDLNGEARLPLASVTKVMMALVAAESLPKESLITITQNDIAEEGDTGLYAGEIWTMEKLLQFTLIASSNDGASAIARTLGEHLSQGTSTDVTAGKKFFIDKMNKRARSIGLTQTSFQNESGLDLGGDVSGTYGSARDMAMLFDYVFRKHPELFIPTSYGALDLRSESGFVHHVTNTNQDAPYITGFIGSKTGYTDLAGGNLVVLVDIGVNHPIVIAVLGSTEGERFTDVKKLIAAALIDITHPTPW